MKILSLNIRHGGGRHVEDLLDWTLSQVPDVIVLVEWQDNPGGRQILDSLRGRGFATATTCRQDPKANGVLIGVKGSLDSWRVTPEDSEGGELLLAGLSLGYRVLAAYFPQGKWKKPFFHRCIEEASRASEVPLLLIGDLNTGRNDLDVEANGTPFHCADLFNALESQARLTDLWRAVRESGSQRMVLAIPDERVPDRPCVWE